LFIVRALETKDNYYKGGVEEPVVWTKRSDAASFFSCATHVL